ncbi:MAG: hypothetical protein KDK36_19085 [Leptospiraceae bacterium]|nr:hypothetical protein [Leptospiraceae bacterium]
MEKLYSQEGIAEIYWDDSCKALCPNWESFSVTDKEIKDVLENLLLFIIDKKCDRQIINTQNARGGFSDTIHDWLENDWIPRAVKVGMKYVATITPKNTFAQLSNDFWQEVSNEIGFFTINVNSHEEGIKWLDQYPPGE